MKLEFDSNRGNYEKLVEMLKSETNVVKISPNTVSYENIKGARLTQKRLEEYRHLMADLNLASIRIDSPNVIRFVRSSKGFLLVSSEKSFVRSEHRPGPVVDSVDELIRKNHSEDQPPVYKKIAPNWYLFYESW
ncbi:MAG: hypothetical protein J5I65_04580 [Aridibacter famidurans]|nr:hypothetical protein [Aridibacter famidurans]